MVDIYDVSDGTFEGKVVRLEAYQELQQKYDEESLEKDYNADQISYWKERAVLLQQELEKMQKSRDRWISDYKHLIDQHMPRTRDGCQEGWSRVIEAQELQQKLDQVNEKLSRYSMSAGQADQFAAEAKYVRKALGFAEDAQDVAPIDLLEKINAIAAENAALKLGISDITFMRDDDFFASTQEAQRVMGVLVNIKTPATEAYLNSIRADAISSFWEQSLCDVGMVLNDIRAFDDSSEAGEIVHSEIKERVDDFVEFLRSGGTV